MRTRRKTTCASTGSPSTRRPPSSPPLAVLMPDPDTPSARNAISFSAHPQRGGCPWRATPSDRPAPDSSAPARRPATKGNNMSKAPSTPSEDRDTMRRSTTSPVPSAASPRGATPKAPTSLWSRRTSSTCSPTRSQSTRRYAHSRPCSGASVPPDRRTVAGLDLPLTRTRRVLSWIARGASTAENRRLIAGRTLRHRPIGRSTSTAVPMESAISA